jgi:hypothetical protein
MVHALLCQAVSRGQPWVKLSGRDGVAASCEKPLTVGSSLPVHIHVHLLDALYLTVRSQHSTRHPSLRTPTFF